MLRLYKFDFSVRMKKGVDIVDITDIVAEAVAKSNVKDGVAHITSIGSTGSVTTIEYEPGAIEDLKRAINELAPPDRYYEHEKAWHDGNGHSHVQSALLGPSESISIRDGKLQLGTWQQIVLINHDIHPRQRKVSLTIIGTDES
jgi:secondary thiamine-phosphate synthase enzyme